MTAEHDDSGSSARTTRLSGHEIRRRMLDTALTTVRARGMTVGFHGLQMDEVIARAGVSRSSVYRLWESKEAFIAELMNESAAVFARQLSDRESLRLTVEIVGSRPDLHTTVEGRQRLTLELIRVVLEQNYYSTIDSVPWQAFLSMSAALLADDRNDKLRDVERTLRDGSDRFVAEMAAFHKTVGSLLGFRLRNDFHGGYELYAVLGSSMVEGLAVRHLSNPSITDNFYQGPPTLSSEPTEWAPSAIGFLAIYNLFMEPDPDFDPSVTATRLHELDIFSRPYPIDDDRVR